MKGMSYAHLKIAVDTIKSNNCTGYTSVLRNLRISFALNASNQDTKDLLNTFYLSAGLESQAQFFVGPDRF